MTLAIRNSRRSLKSILDHIVRSQSAPDDIRKAVRQAWTQGTVAVSSDDPSRVSYARNRSIRYQDDRRTVVALSRFLNRHMAEDVPSREYWVDRIANQYRDRIVDDTQFIMLTGHDVQAAFDDEIGGHSCMTGRYSELTELYALNSNQVSLLVFRETRGRAIVWSADCGTILLDRCYADTDDAKRIMRDYATRQGWVCREGDQATNRGWQGDQDYQVSGLDLPDSMAVPFMDTLDCGTLRGEHRATALGRYNSLDVSGSGSGDCLRNQDGGPYMSSVECACCGERIYEDEMRGEHHTPHGDQICESCFDDRFFHCEECSEPTHRADAVSIPSRYGHRLDVCEDCADHRAPECDTCGDRTLNDDLICSDAGAHCEDCAPEEGGEE